MTEGILFMCENYGLQVNTNGKNVKMLHYVKLGGFLNNGLNF